MRGSWVQREPYKPKLLGFSGNELDCQRRFLVLQKFVDKYFRPQTTLLLSPEQSKQLLPYALFKATGHWLKCELFLPRSAKKRRVKCTKEE
jgi:hypothetical protein